ncbi:hypothetical protein ACN38_g2631 [Penicillium nordicum]|uniref:Uncharacterized protein n=1 Tax=Penicillium nordicum TaxID=229535 RepID=A0A0M8P9M6_9EURO|nr:hypothetical protein ACN38_g2631 [Penicillium nordicum]
MFAVALLQPAPGLASYKLDQKTILSEHYAQIDQAAKYIVHDMTSPLSFHASLPVFPPPWTHSLNFPQN